MASIVAPFFGLAHIIMIIDEASESGSKDLKDPSRLLCSAAVFHALAHCSASLLASTSIFWLIRIKNSVQSVDPALSHKVKPLKPKPRRGWLI